MQKEVKRPSFHHSISFHHSNNSHFIQLEICLYFPVMFKQMMVISIWYLIDPQITDIPNSISIFIDPLKLYIQLYPTHCHCILFPMMFMIFPMIFPWFSHDFRSWRFQEPGIPGSLSATPDPTWNLLSVSDPMWSSSSQRTVETASGEKGGAGFERKWVTAERNGRIFFGLWYIYREREAT